VRDNLILVRMLVFRGFDRNKVLESVLFMYLCLVFDSIFDVDVATPFVVCDDLCLYNIKVNV